MKKKIVHTVIRNQKLFCTHCGGEYVIVYPIGIKELNTKISSFNKLHGDCIPTWKEPEADMSQSIPQRAKWWLQYGERGTSSEGILNVMQGTIPMNNMVHYPLDVDDFKRCYKLLKAIPEWRTNIKKMSDCGLVWSGLADHWEELTKHYEEEKYEILYAKMQTLGC